MNLSLSQLSSAMSKFLHRFHVLIYLFTVVIGVSIAIFMLNQLIAGSPEAEPAPTPSAAFDEATIKRIEEFNTAKTENDNFSLPPGRINPLVDGS